MLAGASIAHVANLSVRKIDDKIYERLKLRAREHGISMEAEVRRILTRAVAAPRRLGDLAVAQFGPDHGIELTLPPRRPHEPPDLGR